MADLKIEARISNRGLTSAKVSVRIELPEGGISINDIFARQRKGKLHINFPLNRNDQPNVYLRGKLKQEVLTAIEKEFYHGAGTAARQEPGA